MNSQSLPPDIGNPYASPNPDLVPPLDIPQTWPTLPVDLTNAIHMGGAVGWEDYRDALRLHMGAKNERSRLARAAWQFLCLVIISVACYVTLPDWRFVFLPLIACALLLIGSLTRYTIRRSWDQSVRIRDPFARAITPEVIQTTSPSSMSLSRWSAFVKFKRSDTTVLLYNDTVGPLHLFPRRLFQNDADWQRFIDLVERNVPAG
jgi:hypothetical protein